MSVNTTALNPPNASLHEPCPATQARIEELENEMQSLLARMQKIAVEIDPILKDRTKEAIDRIVTRKSPQYARENDLFRKLLDEYETLAKYIVKLNPSHELSATVAADEVLVYPRPDCEKLKSPALPEVIKQKPWSWDRIYKYGAALRKRTAKGEITDSEIETIANYYDMLQMDSYASATEFGKKAKEYNPDIIYIGYRNVIIYHETFEGELFKQHPDWFLKDSLTGEYVTHGTEGLKAQKPLFDLRVPEMREWWLNDISNQCENEVYDGVLIDALAKVLSNWGPKRKAIGGDQQSYMKYSQILLDEILAENICKNSQKGLIVANAMRSGYDDCLKCYADLLFHGSYLEWIEGGQSDYEEGLSKLIDALIQIGKEPGDKFICFQFHAGYPPPPKANLEKSDNRLTGSAIMPEMGEHYDDKDKTDDEIAEEMRAAFPYKLAIFLICANKFSYMGYTSTKLVDDDPRRWAPDYPEFNKKIGEPLGHAVKKGEYYYEREFEYVKVKLNVETREAKLEWE